MSLLENARMSSLRDKIYAEETEEEVKEEKAPKKVKVVIKNKKKDK